MLKKILLALVVVVVAFAILVVLQPDEFRVTRSTTISAPPAAVFDHVNDLRKWQAFSPWAKMDPEADVSFEGAPSGTGAVFTWSGNKEVGEGRMTIIASRPMSGSFSGWISMNRLKERTRRSSPSSPRGSIPS
jgi:hypothetical protein